MHKGIYKLVLILTLLVSAAASYAQLRVVKPDLPVDEPNDSGIFPEFSVLLPDSIDVPEAIAFYESQIANLNGRDNKNNQAVILFCLAELKRLGGSHEEALYALAESWRAVDGKLSAQDQGVIMSRLCLNGLHVLKKPDGDHITSGLFRELGYPDFESLMQAGLELTQENNDAMNQEAMLTFAFRYYSQKDRPETAYSYGDKLIRYKDQLASEELKKKLAALQDDYAMAQKEREITLLNNQKVIYEERIRSASRTQWAIIGGIGVLLVLALALWNRVRVIGKTRDLLQVKAAQLQHEKNRAEKSELFKEQFLANVSHEIRTPMNAIMGITNILIKRKHLKEQKKYLTAMHESAKNLLVLINDILDLSKLEAGKVELVNAPFNTREIIVEIENKHREKAGNKGLHFHVNIDDDVPQVLSGDGFVLNNILDNLVENAISFTATGGVDVRCSLAGEEDGMVRLRFSVQDTGLGIVPEKQDKILTTFVKVYEKSSIQYEGSGLELAIINQLVELQGGHIRLESEPNIGTTFFVEIPYGMATEIPLADKSPPRESEHELKDIRVLLVEDNEFNVMVASSELESVIEGLELDLAENGMIALNKLMEKNYDLVLMDVQMPVMDGYEATRRIRKMNGALGKIPIIAMTANVLQQEVEKCLQEGMNDYISKPFDTGELLNKMKRILNVSN